MEKNQEVAELFENEGEYEEYRELRKEKLLERKSKKTKNEESDMATTLQSLVDDCQKD